MRAIHRRLTKKVPPIVPSDTQIVAVSGTATSLAAMDQKLFPYNAARVNNVRINNDTLSKSIEVV